MNAAELLQKMGDTLGSTATVKSVFGEPIHMNGKTVVPVAKVAYGFGGGAGTGKSGALHRPVMDRRRVHRGCHDRHDVLPQAAAIGAE
jgi:uncharacterized spore protein YtfJ